MAERMEGDQVAQGGAGEGMFLPGAGGNRVNGINDFGAEERGPAGLDGPTDGPIGVAQLERGDCREPVEHVAHGADAQNQYPDWPFHSQGPIFSWATWRFVVELW
jgi:hypothetical protein